MTYHVFRFIKIGDNPWEVIRLAQQKNMSESCNKRLLQITRTKSIVTIFIEQDDIELAEKEWKEALHEFYKKRKRASDMAEKSRIRAFDIASSTVDYTRP